MRRQSSPTRKAADVRVVQHTPLYRDFGGTNLSETGPQASRLRFFFVSINVLYALGTAPLRITVKVKVFHTHLVRRTIRVLPSKRRPSAMLILEPRSASAHMRVANAI